MLVFTALGETVRHTFRVSDPILEAVDETAWRIVSPKVGSFDSAILYFDRVMDAALCEDEIRIMTSSGEIIQTRASLLPNGTTMEFIPKHPWSEEEHSLIVSDRFEDVCGNRLGEALDHDLGAIGRPRDGMISFTPTIEFVFNLNNK